MSTFAWPRTAVRLACYARVVIAAFSALAATVVALPLMGSPARAHSGHDHGSPPPLPTSVRPRLAAETDLYQLVAILGGPGKLTLFLDRAANNAPLTDAVVSLVLGEKALPAAPQLDGSYFLDVPELAAPGQHALIFRVVHPDGEDLIAGDLDIPAPVAGELSLSSAPPGRTIGNLLPSAAALLLGLAIGLLAGRRRRRAAVAIVAALSALLSPRILVAHEGHDASPVPDGATLSGDLPRRLADGSVFLSKPSQRLLTILSERASEASGGRAIALLGRIVADPNRSGVVQSINGGRVSPPEAGFPHLGQSVRRGDVLAWVAPALPLADQSTLAEKQRDLEGAISLARQKLSRLSRLGPGVTPRSNIDDTELEIANLEQRLAGLKQAKLAPEILTAPIDGVVSASRAVAGQVVAAQDVLFQIVDTSSLWIEALVFDQLDPGAIVQATAVGADGSTMALSFRGRSRALQAQSVVLQFATDAPPTNAAIGLPVTVIARKAEQVRGMLLPHEALVRGSGGEALVWEHVEPERFVARQVRSEPFDGQKVLVTGGIKAGDRIVVHGAELLSQIR